MRLLIQHRSHYAYPEPAALGPHTVRLRPAMHTRARVEAYSLSVPPQATVHWQQDPFGNHVARLTFKDGERIDALSLVVELALDIRPVNPFDFFVDDRCKQVPFDYPSVLTADIRPFLDLGDPAFACGERANALIESLPRSGDTVNLLVELVAAVNRSVRYVIREESGIYTPEETLAHGQGSCRDFAVLLVAVLRDRGLAARFVSGYLVQLTDEGLIPDEPKGVDRDVVDLHAWVEVFLPGAGWIGLDATSGLFCGEGHIPLAATASPALASPMEGTSDVVATDISFSMKVGRLGHEPRPTAPYDEETWQALLAAGDAADARIASAGLVLTSGGEPTFNARVDAEAPEWNGEALGPTKWSRGLDLARELEKRLIPDAVTLVRSGKHYPGESLPRWMIDVCGRAASASASASAPTIDDARALASALVERLQLGASSIHAAYEDPWHYIREESLVPVDVDPARADLADGEERRRLARVLDRGLPAVVGWVIPLERDGTQWVSETWSFRRDRLYLLPGDSPVGLRLPLASLSPAPPRPSLEPVIDPPDPRREEELAAEQRRVRRQQVAEHRGIASRSARPVRTALALEPRGGRIAIFVPPLPHAEDFFELTALATDLVAGRWPIVFEGYPPSGPDVRKITVSPDPGVLEVNIPPSTTTRAHAELLESCFEAALASGLHCEKYMVDGRQQGSGGGHHVTLGGPTAVESPFTRRPDLLASVLTFFQHHPSLSFMFTGLFVGPTSQAPRVDEARHDTLYELEIALARAFETPPGTAAPWLSDLLFRHLLVDVTGNTHRAEICIDKLFDWRTPHGRQGLLELRAFEMPPHPRMAAAQVALVRAVVAAVVAAPYDTPLVRWGQALHDRFLLPYFMTRDFDDVLDELARRGIELPRRAYEPFVDLRCPLVGTMHTGDVTVEVRNAIEPWHVLGEEPAQGGTSRYVDSSVERVEVRMRGGVAGRHVLVVNGYEVPMHPTHRTDERVAGVRFRAWAPPHSLHAHIGVHHPLRFDVLDTWAKRSLGGCAYHVWHPEGRAFLTPPLTRFEAAARRAQRFTIEGPSPWPVRAVRPELRGDAPCTLDLRRFTGDRFIPPPPDEDVG